MSSSLLKVAPFLAANAVDAFLISNLHNVRYLTGFTGSNAILLVMPEEMIFFSDPRYRLQAAAEVSEKTVIAAGNLFAAATQLAVRKKVKRMAVEQTTMTLGEAELLRGKFEIRAAAGVIEGMRMVKAPEEIERIRKSVSLNSQAFEQALKKARPGMREYELSAEIDYRMRRLGAEAAAFETIVAAGPRSALPHAKPGDARLEKDQLLLIDMGATLNGYTSDMTRMAHFGKPPKKVREAYDRVLEAQLAAIAAVRPGKTGAQVDKAARDVLKASGLGDAFVHSTGHGFGLEIHEDPRIGKSGKAKLAAGMTITIEPGIYLEGWGGIRIEDTVLVTEAGCEVLTPTSKELRVV
jgi:Xaa-Pro aminopeptidase